MINTNRLQTIKETIENMNKVYQIEVLRILYEEKTITLSENNNGVFINLTDLDIELIEKLDKYIEYVNEQQNQLTSIENEKINIKNEFFTSDKKKSINISRNKFSDYDENTNTITNAISNTNTNTNTNDINSQLEQI